METYGFFGNRGDETAGARGSIGSNSGELSSILKLLSDSAQIENIKFWRIELDFEASRYLVQIEDLNEELEV